MSVIAIKSIQPGYHLTLQSRYLSHYIASQIRGPPAVNKATGLTGQPTLRERILVGDTKTN